MDTGVLLSMAKRTALGILGHFQLTFACCVYIAFDITKFRLYSYIRKMGTKTKTPEGKKKEEQDK